MTEIRKTLAILKVRWPEVALIIGIYLLAILSNRLLAEVRLKSIRTINLIIPFVSLLLLLIRTLLRCGFLRTIYLEGPKRQSPLVLLLIGMHFLWRMFVLSLIYSLPFILSFLIFSNLIHRYISSDKLTFSHIVFWFNTLYSVFVNLVLIKLILLIPALIIVLDCGVFDGFKSIRQYKLSKAKELVILYCVNIAIGIFVSILLLYCQGASCRTTCCSAITTSQYILRIMSSTVANFISLMIAVMAVRFVASVNLAHDGSLASLDFEDLQESQNRDLKE